jgi:hypothetical protein
MDRDSYQNWEPERKPGCPSYMLDNLHHLLPGTTLLRGWRDGELKRLKGQTAAEDHGLAKELTRLRGIAVVI